jgi:alanine dehydrogenase
VAHVGEPTLWLSEADVAATVSLADAVVAVRDALVAEHAGQAATMAKTALAWDGGHTLHAVGGVDHAGGLVGTKTWAHTAGGAQPVLAVWDVTSGRLEAMIEAFALGQLRTAAVSAVAIDALARPEATVLAMIGTGKQALAQVAAAVDRRPIGEVRVFSPTVAHRDQFAARLRAHVAAVAVDDVAAATAGADIVITATRARRPIVEAGMLGPHTLVVAVGAITPERAEIDEAVAAAAALVTSDSPTTAGELSHELDGASTVIALSAVVAWVVDAPADGHRVFKAMGLGLADLAVAGEVLRRCRAGGRGTPIADRQRTAPRLFRGG